MLSYLNLCEFAQVAQLQLRLCHSLITCNFFPTPIDISVESPNISIIIFMLLNLYKLLVLYNVCSIEAF